MKHPVVRSPDDDDDGSDLHHYHYFTHFPSPNRDIPMNAIFATLISEPSGILGYLGEILVWPHD
jgi:hypothetical protein